MWFLSNGDRPGRPVSQPALGRSEPQTGAAVIGLRVIGVAAMSSVQGTLSQTGLSSNVAVSNKQSGNARRVQRVSAIH